MLNNENREIKKNISSLMAEEKYVEAVCCHRLSVVAEQEIKNFYLLIVFYNENRANLRFIWRALKFAK